MTFPGLTDRAARLLDTDGTSTPVAAAGDRFTLRELQRAVGGFVEVVNVPDMPDVVLLVDEDGIRHKLPPNAGATALAGTPIVGRALLVRRAALD